jgi:hypothetical protein
MRAFFATALLIASVTAASAQVGDIINKCFRHQCCSNGSNCLVENMLNAPVSLASVTDTDGLPPIWRHPTVQAADPFCHAFPLGCGG